MHTFLILVVLYKKNILESETLQSILQSEHNFSKYRLVVWDNSPVKMLDKQALGVINEKISVDYLHNSRNESLSVVYNEIVEKYERNYSFIILFDHDTLIPSDFFDKTEIAVGRMSKKCRLILPKVKAHFALVSPANLYLFYGRRLKKVSSGYMASKNKTAINSGMIIDTHLFLDGFRYDTTLNFYGIDNYFMEIYAKKYPLFYVLDVELTHSLDYFNGNESFERRLGRFQNMSDAILYINSKGIFRRGLCILYLFIVKCRFKLRYKYFNNG